MPRRSSEKFSNEPINEFLYDRVQNGDDGPTVGDDERNGTYQLINFSGGVFHEDIDDYNKQKSDWNDMLNAEETITLCMSSTGAIVHERTDGGVTAEVFSDAIDMQQA